MTTDRTSLDHFMGCVMESLTNLRAAGIYTEETTKEIAIALEKRFNDGDKNLRAHMLNMPVHSLIDVEATAAKRREALRAKEAALAAEIERQRQLDEIFEARMIAEAQQREEEQRQKLERDLASSLNEGWGEW